MSAIVDALLAELDDDALERLAERLAPRLAARMGDAGGSPWLNAEDAARYIAGTKGRLYDLVQLGKLAPARDGRRLLFHRDDLDEYLRASR